MRDHLGPQLAASRQKKAKLIVWDHNKDILYDRAAAVLTDKKAAKRRLGPGHPLVRRRAARAARAHARLLARQADHLHRRLLGTRRQARPMGPRRTLRPAHHQRSQSLGRRLDRLERRARPARRAQPRRQLLRRLAARRYRARRGALPDILPLHRTLQPLHPSGRRPPRLARPPRTHVNLRTLACRNTDGSIAAVILNTSEETVSALLAFGNETVPVSLPPRSIRDGGAARVNS